MIEKKQTHTIFIVHCIVYLGQHHRAHNLPRDL